MQTLSNGFQKPETGDRGSAFFPALEDNIQKTNDHTHNGTNSEKLTPESIAGLNATILPGDWLVSGTIFRAALTMPGNKVFDTTTIRLVANNRILYADVEKVTANTFYVYINDNSLTVTVLYL